jgi:hypothetical protein
MCGEGLVDCTVTQETAVLMTFMKCANDPRPVFSSHTAILKIAELVL